jgi:DNA-binding XRE family transcriptional regulator
MAIDEEFRRFKQIREELNLTQAAFAEELGVSATTADIETRAYAHTRAGGERAA